MTKSMQDALWRFGSLALVLVITLVLLIAAKPGADTLLYLAIGGVFAGAAFELVVEATSLVREKWTAGGFERFFGEGSLSGELYLIYSTFEPRPDLPAPSAPSAMFPYKKRTTRPSGYIVRVVEPVAAHDLRGLNYVASRIGSVTPCPPAMRSMIEADAEPKDRNFIAFGLGSNDMTLDALSDSSQGAVRISADQGSIIHAKSGEPVASATHEYDVGFILRVKPADWEGKHWIACAGLGEWGTSGSSYYLARNWERISKMKATDGKRVRNRPFLAVIRVQRGKDESAKCVEVLALN